MTPDARPRSHPAALTAPNDDQRALAIVALDLHKVAPCEQLSLSLGTLSRTGRNSARWAVGGVTFIGKTSVEAWHKGCSRTAMDELLELYEQLESWALMREKNVWSPDHIRAKFARELLSEFRALQRDKSGDDRARASRGRVLQAKARSMMFGTRIASTHAVPLDRRSTVKLRAAPMIDTRESPAAV